MTMSQLDCSGSLDLFNLCKQLLQAGWDAFASDLAGEVAARRENAPNGGTWTLTIDRSGRWRFIATREIGIADGRELVRGGHVLRLLKKNQQVLTVAGNLRSQDDLPEMLVELNQLALEESGQPAAGVEGEPRWKQGDDLHAGKGNL
jgi:hypothetical protein